MEEQESEVYSETIADQLQELIEVNQDVNDSLVLQNQILTGMIYFMGAIFGAILLKILWDKLR